MFVLETEIVASVRAIDDAHNNKPDSLFLAIDASNSNRNENYDFW